MNTIYTIGYSGFSVENFVKALKDYGVTALIDVRSTPHSAYYKEFDKENISRVLRNEKIIYRNYAEEFGARQLDRNFYTGNTLDFVKFAESPQFLEGVEKIKTGMEQGYEFAFMCAEKRPETCHRCILVARKFHELGYDVRHILEEGNYITQAQVENILVDKYFPNHNQISLFETPDMDR